MRNVINYYYGLYPKNIFQNKEEYYFFIDNIRYTLIEYLGELNEIEKIYNMHLEILRKNIYVHPIILNIDGKPYTKVNNKNYILLQTIYYGEKVTLNHIRQFLETEVPSIERQDWKELWSRKNDYLEYQIRELGQKHPVIRDSFSYFIGMGETAIAIANIMGNQNSMNVFAHKRISKNDTTFDLYNPLNITVDLKVRDIAEYFKQNFFKGENIDKELTEYFNHTQLSVYEYMMFLARMIYPTYYFDIYEEIITGRENDKNIINIIDKIEEYEKILKKIYYYYKTFMDIIPIEWLE